MPSSGVSSYIAEVIETSTTQFRAECRVVHEPPALGSFVKICPRGVDCTEALDPFGAGLPADGTVFALVIEASSGSGDPNRRPAAFGLDEDDLPLEQPQISELLTTCFTARIVGHVANGTAVSFLPDRPPALHSRVHGCTPQEVRAATESVEYVRAALDSADSYGADEVIAASLRAASAARGYDEAYLIRAGKELSLILRDDYDRLASILRKVRGGAG